MKKILMVFVAAVSFGLVACDGAKKSTDDATTTTETETVVVEDAPVNKSLVDQYEDLMNKSIELQKKVKAGDMSVQEEATKLANEIMKFTQDNQEALQNLSEADAKRFQEIGQKAAQEMMAQ